MCELPHELPNDLKLRKSRNFKKIPEVLGVDGKYPTVRPKAKFLILFGKKSQKNQP